MSIYCSSVSQDSSARLQALLAQQQVTANDDIRVADDITTSITPAYQYQEENAGFYQYVLFLGIGAHLAGVSIHHYSGNSLDLLHDNKSGYHGSTYESVASAFEDPGTILAANDGHTISSMSVPGGPGLDTTLRQIQLTSGTHQGSTTEDPDPTSGVLLLCIKNQFHQRMLVRLLILILGHLLGVAITLSVAVTPARPLNALPSIGDDSSPIMFGQLAASFISPLLFTIISTAEAPASLRTRMLSFHFDLLVLGVLISMVSLILHVRWPGEYRAADITTIVSVMLTVLGGWQFLEKSWKEVDEKGRRTSDVELRTWEE
ncbi:Uu.00g023840.m01.CDS01 [Anthostomella pinea]|uniref:Uu.00g023840.m01.CDS01 n=1 Tax=Anthostomella pinea TaxID=933095 RepID=A0AAI8W122_9PEZI|nr:Uu.00g023840.m01.CDS01 [Anthostomella pinea]